MGFFAVWTFCLLALVAIACQPAASSGPSVVVERPQPAVPFTLLTPIDWSELPKHTGEPNGVPPTLVSPNGRPFPLLRFEAVVMVEGPLALTRLHLQFDNPGQDAEGRFSIVLPDGAAPVRFATSVGERLVEGELIDRRRVDSRDIPALREHVAPGLLEREFGQRLDARLFTTGSFDVHLWYVQPLASGEAYRLPLVGLSRTNELEVTVQVAAPAAAPAEIRGYRLMEGPIEPDRDFSLALARLAPPSAIRAQQLALARVRLDGATVEDVPSDLLILLDTSASRLPRLASDLARLGEVLRELSHHNDPTIEVVTFDQEVRQGFVGKASGFGASQVQALLAQGASGASNGGLMLGALARHSAKRAWLIGDVAFTIGDNRPQSLRELVAKSGVERLDVLLSGANLDRVLAQELARSGRRAGLAFDLEQPTKDLARRLLRTGQAAAIELEAATESRPRSRGG